MKICYKWIWIGLFSIVACEQAPSWKERLAGQWQAGALHEEGVPKNIEGLQDVGFRFALDGRYVFQNHLKYKEAGRFRVRGGLLYTTDTTALNKEEKAVKIVKLTTDSLSILMKEEGRERLLELQRVEE